MRIDEIKNTQKNGGREKGIVVNPHRWDITGLTTHRHSSKDPNQS
jgi:hypothetical protein